MVNIHDHFRKALQVVLAESPVGTQSRLTEALGLSSGYISAIKNGSKNGGENLKRQIAAYFGYQGSEYERFLDIGRGVNRTEPSSDMISDFELKQRCFFSVPFSDNLMLTPLGKNGVIEITYDEQTTPVVVHGPTIKRRNARFLRACKMPDSKMAPYINRNALVLIDMKSSDIIDVQNGEVYLICYDFRSGQCLIRCLSIAHKDLVAISAYEQEYPVIYKKKKEIKILGKVIWVCHDFENQKTK